MGYITQYASSAIFEDFVETLSCTITDTDCRWMYTIIDACANGGVKAGDKERIYALIDSLGIQDLDTPGKPWNKFKILKETSKTQDSEEEVTRFVPSFHQADAQNQNNELDQDKQKTLKYEDVKSFTSFRDYLDNWVEIDQSATSKGMNAILKKLEIAGKWYTDEWGLHLFDIRREVRERQNNINTYAKDNVTTIYPINKATKGI